MSVNHFVLDKEKIPVSAEFGLHDFGPDLTPFCEEKKSEDVPFFSIIIPAYQRKNELKATLETIREQSARSELFEIIVVDDGSSDNTQDLLKAEAITSRCNFKAFYFQREKSDEKAFRAGVARNIGVKAAAGKFIIFLDSDILLPSHFITQLLEKTKENKIIQPLRMEGGHLTDEGFLLPLLKKDWNAFENKWKFLCSYCLCIEKKLIYKVGGFRTTFSTYGLEDTELGYRLAKAGENFFLMDAVVIHQGNGFQPSIFERRRAMAQSAQLFYNTYLDEDIYYEYIWLWPVLSFERKLSVFRVAIVLLQKRGWANLIQKIWAVGKSYLIKSRAF